MSFFGFLFVMLLLLVGASIAAKSSATGGKRVTEQLTIPKIISTVRVSNNS